MSRRPYYVAFGATLLLVIVTLNLPAHHALQAKLVCGSVFRPLFGLAAAAGDLAAQTGTSLLPRSLLVRQLEAARKENEDLRFQIRQLETARLENQRLRAALGWQPQAAWPLRVARVLGQDPANWWRSILIDLGSREGLRTNQTVLTPDGLVGRVSEVAYTRARVLLVGDPNCQFSGQVEDTRDKGIVAPDEFSFDRQLVNFTFVPAGVVLRPGGRIVTSGDGGVFPKGIPVGRIVDVQTNNAYGLYLEARVRLAVNLNRLDEVWVIFP